MQLTLKTPPTTVAWNMKARIVGSQDEVSFMMALQMMQSQYLTNIILILAPSYDHSFQKVQFVVVGGCEDEKEEVGDRLTAVGLPHSKNLSHHPSHSLQPSILS